MESLVLEKVGNRPSESLEDADSKSTHFVVLFRFLFMYVKDGVLLRLLQKRKKDIYIFTHFYIEKKRV